MSGNYDFFVSFLLACIANVATATEADANNKDLNRLQGTWIVTSAEKGGEKMPDEMCKSVKLVIEGNRIKVWMKDKEDHEQEIEIDSTKEPKEINLTKLLDGKKSTVPGIYSFDGDSWKLCGDDAGKERPKEFSTKDKPNYSLLTLRRM